MLLEVVALSLVAVSVQHQETVSVVDEEKYSIAKDKRYIIYDVNYGEGFNLRRDVYMRAANVVRQLRERGENALLVLPPWGGLYHWHTQRVKQRWDLYFDTESMSRFAPVMEFEDFLKEYGSTVIDQVVYLQHFAEGWGDEYVMKWEKRACIEAKRHYRKDDERLWEGWFFSYTEVRARNLQCVSIQGDSKKLVEMIFSDYPSERVLFVDRMETILHDHYGDITFWNTRRSMRYSPRLAELGDKFRESQLESTDEKDSTALPVKWETRKTDVAIGGPYVCAHWRRRDFVRAHGGELPSLKGTAEQLNKLVEKLDVPRVFLATDAPLDEVNRLKEMVKVPVIIYRNDDLSDGEVAIIDQASYYSIKYICARARYFVGSHVSTFSYRIQEDREILNFPPEMTFNRMCPDAVPECEQPAKWRIAY